MEELGRRRRNLPAPPAVVWRSLVDPEAPGARPWLRLLDDEVAPKVLSANEPREVRWSSLWPARPDDELHFRLIEAGGGTDLEFVMLTPDEVPDAGGLGHLRRRVNTLLFADLRYSYGQ
jgi:hypothetical protein